MVELNVHLMGKLGQAGKSKTGPSKMKTTEANFGVFQHSVLVL